MQMDIDNVRLNIPPPPHPHLDPHALGLFTLVEQTFS